MITITINGETERCAPPENLQVWLQYRKTLPKYFAVAVNGQFVAKENYHQQAIEHGCEIEILIPMQGG